LLARGVRTLERGSWFVSTAHTDQIIDSTLVAAAAALDDRAADDARFARLVTEASQSRLEVP
jgi:hypothetical protein